MKIGDRVRVKSDYPESDTNTYNRRGQTGKIVFPNFYFSPGITTCVEFDTDHSCNHVYNDSLELIEDEFVECVSVSDFYPHYTVGKIYKVLGEHILDNEGKQGAYSKNRSISQFKPSTKETFDKQNMKDEFVIPKQWHINVKTPEQAKVVGRWFDQSEFVCAQTSNFYEKEGDLGIYGGVSPGNVFGNEVGTEITFEQFEKYILKNKTNMKKEIIGYLSPVSIGLIPKGTLYIVYGGNDDLYISEVTKNESNKAYYSVPKEIVETSWEPVYKEDQTKTLVLGTGKIKVVISKGKIDVDNGNVIVYKDLLNVYRIMTDNNTKITGSGTSYTVSFPKGVRIGCSDFEISEIEQIINTYNELNK